MLPLQKQVVYMAELIEILSCLLSIFDVSLSNYGSYFESPHIRIYK